MMQLILASASPSRAAILRGAGVEPVIYPTNVDEEAIQARLHGADPSTIVAELARAKAHAASAALADASSAHPQAQPDAVIIGGDSMLLIGGALQGKPHTEEATIARWREQAGQRAELLTGHCLLFGDKVHVETSRTIVEFAAAHPDDIAAYAATGEPLECAGAFTLEALGGWFIDRIEGDPSSVIGLSLPVVRRALYSFGLRVSDFWPAPAEA